MNNKSKKLLFTAFVVLAIFIFVIYKIIDSGITGPIDNKFGDQYLKTVVSLVEMHKLRNGTYPESLSELKYVGDWDRIGIQNVNYYTNCDHTKYYLEVTRGWAAKPKLVMEVEFWHGTGYSADLARCEK